MTFTVVSGPGTIAGGALVVTGAGAIVVEADQAGTADYAPAAPVRQTLTVVPAGQTISFALPPGPVTYGVAPIPLSATGGGSGNPIVYTVVSGPGTITGGDLVVTGAGAIVVEADQAGSANYAPALPVRQTLTVVPAAQTIAFALPPGPVTYGAAPIPLTATGGGSGNPVTFTVVSGPGAITGGTLAVTGAGAIVVEADQAGTADYAPATPVRASLTVAPAGQTISFALPPGPVTYGSPPLPLTATGGGSGNPVTFTVVSGPGAIAGGDLVVTGAGVIVVEADQAGTANYTAAPPVRQTLTVAPAAQTIAFALPPGPVTYGAAPIPLSATGGGSGNPVTFTVVSGPGAITGGTLAVTGAGVIVVEADQAGAANYTAAAPVRQSLTVTPTAQAIAFTLPTSPTTYGVAPIPLSATGGGSGNPVTFTVVSGPGTIAGGALVVTGAGVIVVEADQAGTADYAPALPVRQTLTVAPAGQTIAFALPPGPVTYGSPPLTLTATGGGSGNPIVYTIVSGPGVISGGALAVTGAGAIVVEADQAGTTGYAPAPPVRQTLTVAPAVLTVRANDTTSQAGGPLPTLTDTVTGLVAGDSPAVLTGVTLTTPATAASPAGRYAILASGGTAANYIVVDRNGMLTLTPVVPPPPPPPPPAAPPPRLVGYAQFAAGTADGSVQLYNPDGTLRYSTTPFGTDGGVRTAAADFNGDGIADLVVGTGPGGPSHVQILDGKDGHVLFSLDPFEASFTGGVYVAAGDVTGDGVPDLVVTPDQGGGPRVRVFDGRVRFQQVIDFFGIDDPAFRGGARAAVGDVNGDGVADLIVAAGFQGGPRVAGYDGKSLWTGTPAKIFADFYAFEPGLRNGIFLAVGDVTGDGYADLIAGGGPGGGPRVTVFDGKALLSNQYATVADFFAGDPANRGGVRVAVKNLDGDSLADFVTGPGDGGGAHVTGYLGKDLSGSAPPAAFGFDASPGSLGGVFVG